MKSTWKMVATMTLLGPTIHVGRSGIAFRIRLGALSLNENGGAKNCYRASILMLFKKACVRRACNAVCYMNSGSCHRAKSYFAYAQQVMQA